MKRSSSVSVKSATRAIDILEFVGTSAAPPTYGQIRARLRIPNSSLYYLLNTLVQRGYLVQNGERGGYNIGDAVGRLTSKNIHSPSWQALAAPLLDRITDALGETSHYVEQRSHEIECVLTKLGTHMLVTVVRPGQRAPLHAFSGGKIFLANMTDEAIDAYFTRVRLQKITPHTICNKKELWRQILQIRATGFAYSHEEFTLGITGISVGLRASGRLVGTIGVAVPTVRLSRKAELAARNQLTAAASIFSQMSLQSPTVGRLARPPG